MGIIKHPYFAAVAWSAYATSAEDVLNWANKLFGYHNSNECRWRVKAYPDYDVYYFENEQDKDLFTANVKTMTSWQYNGVAPFSDITAWCCATLTKDEWYARNETIYFNLLSEYNWFLLRWS